MTNKKVANIRYKRDWGKRTSTLTLRGGRSGYGRVLAEEVLPHHLPEEERMKVVQAFMIVAAQNGYVGIWDDYDNKFMEA